MGRYLDSLTAQFDEITEGIEDTLNRAADEGREVTADEATAVERDQAKAEELKKAIDHYGQIEITRSKVAEIRSRVPAGAQRTTTAVVVEREKDPDLVLREAFPTAGDYIVTAGKAMRGDKAALEQIERATQHQTLADNPGIVPRPIVGPVITAVGNERPFIASIANKRLPAGSFDRPNITQHVGVGVQAAEKDLTESRKLLLGKLPVTAKTFAGHLNISRQDIKWTQPGIMQIVAEDFAHEYAVETDQDACTQFVASITNAPIPVATFDAASVTAAIFQASVASMSLADGSPLPDTFWVAPDVWGALGGLVNNNGVQVFPSMTATATNGNPLGLKLVVDPFFPAGTAIVGPSRYAEWFEDVDGFMSVAEPDVLGQLVGYAGYGAFLNTKPALFNELTITLPAAAPAPPAEEPPAAKTASK